MTPTTHLPEILEPLVAPSPHATSSLERYTHDLPWSADDEAQWQLQQARLPQIWQHAVDDPYAEQTVVIIPSMSLDVEELHKLRGAVHYEERMLFLLILLRMPMTRVIFVTSTPIDPSIVDYYLQLLPGVPSSHARQRLQMLSAHDASIRPLTQKILERPALIQRIRNCIGNKANAHMTVFNATMLERKLSVALGIPMFGPQARHHVYGTKSGARKLFREVGVDLPSGREDLRDAGDVADAIASLYLEDRNLRKVVVKLNEGFSGDGNAVYPLSALKHAEMNGRLTAASASEVVRKTMPTLMRFQAAGLEFDQFMMKFRQMRGVAEAFIEGKYKASPSCQLRLTPLGEVEIVSTHDQILGGPDGQVFVGCRFPARKPYRLQLHDAARAVGERLVREGVTSRLAIDFMAVRVGVDEWRVKALEINLRKGGTTHPYRTLQLLTGGAYYADRGLFVTGSGDVKYYVASDNLESEKYHGLVPRDLIDITTWSRLHYRSSSNTGSVFHMIGALSEFGKLGVTCIADSPREAQMMYNRTVATLDEQCQTTQWVVPGCG